MSATRLGEGPFGRPLDDPSAEFIEQMSARYIVEDETDRLLRRKMERRAGPAYTRTTEADLTSRLSAMLNNFIEGGFEISDQRWFTGGVSKIQLGFTLRWHDETGERLERLVVRMDPSESLNATSRVRERDLLTAFQGVIPVPRVFWVDEDARWFPEPALIYEFVDGVTKPSSTVTGKVSGMGTDFGERLRALLAPQFLEHLAKIHTFNHRSASLPTMSVPAVGTRDAALWQLNRARRVWEEDRGADFPLMEVAANWLERNAPSLDVVSVVHGDYRSGNFLFDEKSGRITAWLDWERAHLGDRHRDLAWTTQALFGHYSEDGATYFASGLIPLDEFFSRYEEASGLPVDMDRLAYYRILNCYQIVVSTLATSYRIARLGKTHQDVLVARVKGEAPIVAEELRGLLKERL